MTLVTLDSSDRILTVTMHDGARRNALTMEMLNALTAVFDDLSAETRVVILRAGDDQPVWCAGFDIRALAPGSDPLKQEGPLQTLFSRIAACPAPVIAMVRGSTWGGGTDLALRCDMVIADTTSSFAFTPAKLGLPYDAGGLLNVLLRVGSGVALEMFATAEPIVAERALAVGLINHLVPPETLQRFTDEMARRIASNAPLTVSSAKHHLRALATSVSLAPPIAEMLTRTRARALESEDYEEGLDAFASKRRPNFRGR